LFMIIKQLPETPMFVPLFCLGLVCIIAVRLGIEVLGRTTTYFLPILLFILELTLMRYTAPLRMKNRQKRMTSILTMEEVILG